MSKQNGLYDGDEFGNIDWGESDFGEPSNSSKHSRTAKTVLDSVLRGGKNKILDKEFQRAFIGKALPPGWDKGYKGLLDGIGQIGSAASEVSRQFDETNKEIKESVRNLLPSIESVVPKKITDKLRKYAGDDPQSDYYSQDESDLAAGLAEVFGSMKESNDKQRIDLGRGIASTSKSVLAMGMLQSKGQIATNKMLAGILDSQRALTTYTLKIQAGWQRKSLEMQYRQYFVSRKTMESINQLVQLSSVAFRDLVRNTGMPDLVKMTTGEYAEQILKQKFIGGAIDKFQSTVGRRVMSKIRGKATGWLKDLGSNAGDVMSALSMTSEQVQSVKDMGGNPWELLQEMLGEEVGGHLTKRLGKRIGRFIHKRTKDNKGLQAKGLAAKNLAADFPFFLKSLMSGQYTGVKALDDVIDFFDLGDIGEKKTKYVQSSMVPHLDGATHHSIQTKKTINEVIPGFLSKMLSELTLIRRGDKQNKYSDRDDKDAITGLKFDFERGNFGTIIDAKNRIRKDVYQNKERMAIQKELDPIVKGIVGGAHLSAPTIRALKHWLLEQSHEGLHIDFYALATGTADGFTGQAAEEVAAAASKHLGVKELQDKYADRGTVANQISALKQDLDYQKKTDVVASGVRRLRDVSSKAYDRTIKHAQAGDIDLLDQLGITKYEDGIHSIDQDKLFDYIIGHGNRGGDKKDQRRHGRPHVPSGPDRIRPDYGDGNLGVKDIKDKVTTAASNAASNAKKAAAPIVKNGHDLATAAWRGMSKTFKNKFNTHVPEEVRREVREQLDHLYAEAVQEGVKLSDKMEEFINAKCAERGVPSPFTADGKAAIIAKVKQHGRNAINSENAQKIKSQLDWMASKTGLKPGMVGYDKAKAAIEAATRRGRDLDVHKLSEKYNPLHGHPFDNPLTARKYRNLNLRNFTPITSTNNLGFTKSVTVSQGPNGSVLLDGVPATSTQIQKMNKRLKGWKAKLLAMGTFVASGGTFAATNDHVTSASGSSADVLAQLHAQMDMTNAASGFIAQHGHAAANALTTAPHVSDALLSGQFTAAALALVATVGIASLPKIRGAISGLMTGNMTREKFNKVKSLVTNITLFGKKTIASNQADTITEDGQTYLLDKGGRKYKAMLVDGKWVRARKSKNAVIEEPILPWHKRAWNQTKSMAQTAGSKVSGYASAAADKAGDLLKRKVPMDFQGQMEAIIRTLWSIEKKASFGGSILGSLGSMFGGAGQLAGKAVSGTWNAAKGIYGVGASIRNGIWGATKSVIGGTWNAGKDWVLSPSDIYVKGQSEPVMLAKLMEGGEYRLKSDRKKIITSIKDITGPVVNRAGNVVVSKADIEAGLYTQTGKRLGWLGNKAWALTKGLVKMPFMGFAWAGAIAGTAWKATKWVYNKATEIEDVYVPGEDTPRILGERLRDGKYFLRGAKKPIRWLSDIVDAVYEENENPKAKKPRMVLSKKEIEAGVVDAFGKPISLKMSLVRKVAKNPFKAVWNMGAGIVTGTSKMAWGALKGVYKLGKKVVVGSWNLIAHGLGGLGLYASTAQTVTELQRIYQLLDERIPKASSGLDDTGNKLDTSGFRKGSVEDQNADKEAEAKKKSLFGGLKDKMKDGLEKGKSKMKSIMDIMRGGNPMLMALGKYALMGEGLKLMYRHFFPESEKDKAEDDADAKANPLWHATKAIGGTLAVGAAGMWGARKLGGLAKRGVVAGGKAIVKRALPWLGRAALPAIGEGLLAAGGFALEAGAAVLGGLATIISAPVVLIGAAIAAVVYVGYKLYKNYKNKSVPLTRLRMAQYGYSMNSGDAVTAILDMESVLLKNLVLTKGRSAQIGKGNMTSELLKIFKIDVTSHEDVKKWVLWFSNRFKPVFLAHCTAAYDATGSADLTKIDDVLGKTKKKEFLAKVMFNDPVGSPYNVIVSPFHTGWFSSSKVDFDLDDVKDVIKDSTDKINDMKDDAADTKVTAASGDPKKAAANKAKAGAVTPKPADSKSWFQWSIDGVKSAVEYARNGLSDAMTSASTLGAKVDALLTKLANSDIAQGAKKAAIAVGTGAFHAAQAVGNTILGGKANAEKVGSFIGGAVYSGVQGVKSLLGGSEKKGAWSPNKSATLFDNIAASAKKYGVDEGYMRVMANIESRGDAHAKAPTSSAKGIYQFIDSTAKKYGLSDPYNEAANVDAGARFAADNQKYLMKHVTGGSVPPPWMLYLAHQQGPGGADTLVKMAQSGQSPSGTLRNALDLNGGRGMNAAQFLQHWQSMYASRASQIGVSGGTAPSLGAAAGGKTAGAAATVVPGTAAPAGSVPVAASPAPAAPSTSGASAAAAPAAAGGAAAATSAASANPSPAPAAPDTSGGDVLTKAMAQKQAAAQRTMKQQAAAQSQQAQSAAASNDDTASYQARMLASTQNMESLMTKLLAAVQNGASMSGQQQQQTQQSTPQPASASNPKQFTPDSVMKPMPMSMALQ